MEIIGYPLGTDSYEFFALPPVSGERSMKNLLLDLVSQADLELLKPHLRPTSLKQHNVLFEPDEEIRHVYFPAGAIISLIVTLSTGEMIEAAMVGIDGVVGASAALDGKVSLSRGVVQLSGAAVMCDLEALKSVALRSPGLLSLLIRHEQTVYAQAQQSAACFATHHVQARFCRWLLRARDLSDSDTFSFTQEYLAEMLGVRRTSVTFVAHTLQTAGFIKYSRGRIQILNAEALAEGACECYETVKRHYEKLVGMPR
jgi:CRP-like cAMP-binding protein